MELNLIDHLNTKIILYVSDFVAEGEGESKFIIYTDASGALQKDMQILMPSKGTFVTTTTGFFLDKNRRLQVSVIQPVARRCSIAVIGYAFSRR